MRSFTFVGGGSGKFWEVGREGATVTVRFGRIGTRGQTQTKELAGAQAARDHVEKLVAEKLAKGYVEDGTARPDAPSGPAAMPPSATEPEPQPEPEPEAHDEDTWVVPAAWWNYADPWRGVSPPHPVAVDAAKAAAYLRLRNRAGRRLDEVLADPGSDADLVEAASRHLGPPRRKSVRPGEPQPDPLGAAVVGAVTAMAVGWNEHDSISGLADDWVREHGIAFAAEAGALLAGVEAYVPGHPYYGWYTDRAFAVRRPGPGTTRGNFELHDTLGRLRAFLASADDATYAEAVRRLEALRARGPEVRAATSFLLPTQRDWVEADIQEAVSRGGQDVFASLVASASTPDQVRALFALRPPWQAGLRPGLLHGAAAYAGPGIAPVLAEIYEDGDADRQKRVVAILAQLPTDEAFGLLLARLDQRYVQPAVLEAMNRFPRRAVRLLAAASTGAGARAGTARELLRGHLVSHPGLADRVALTGAAAAALQKVAASAVAVAPAAPEAVPPLLARPPWEHRGEVARPAVAEGLRVPAGLDVAWEPGEQQRWADPNDRAEYRRSAQQWAQVAAEILSGYGRSWSTMQVIAYGPEHQVRPLLDRQLRPDDHPQLRWLKLILGRFGRDAATYALREAVAAPRELAPALLPVRGAQVAPHMAEWLARLKSVRPAAQAWLLRHPDAAAQGLLPAAVGKPGKERAYAEAALRFLAANGRRDAAEAAAKAAGPAAVGAVEALLSVDPVDVLPARMPALPAWLDPAHLPPVRLADRGGALPGDAVANLCLMLALCKPGETYAGLEVVRRDLDAADLAAFARALFERWRRAEYPSRDSWVLEAQGLLGDDETVRRLAPLIRAWPGEGASARAANALDVLSAIGSDVALMHLHSISEKSASKALKAKASERIGEIAEDLGLTPDQLADRLVPDLGLDERGGMVLDYGPRRFRVGFDEQLKPVVLDEDGSRRKLLPKPAAKDDAALAEAAYARFAGLKKDVKLIATDQIKRLERAMVEGRRWTAGEHRRLFVDHPLLTHLAARLVWLTVPDGQLASSLTVGQDSSPPGSFRVAEDHTYADETDSEVEVPDDAAVALAHPLHLGAESLRAWAEVFADYEILQPFAQLGRDTYALTEEERERVELARFSGSVVPTGRVLGLTHRGWERGSPVDSGVHAETYRHVGGGRYVVVDLDPGIIAGAAMEEPRQTLTRVWLSRGAPEWGKSQGTLAFGELDAVTVSELLRDLEMLRG